MIFMICAWNCCRQVLVLMIKLKEGSAMDNIYSTQDNVNRNNIMVPIWQKAALTIEDITPEWTRVFGAIDINV